MLRAVILLLGSKRGHISGSHLRSGDPYGTIGAVIPPVPGKIFSKLELFIKSLRYKIKAGQEIIRNKLVTCLMVINSKIEMKYD